MKMTHEGISRLILPCNPSSHYAQEPVALSLLEHRHPASPFSVF